MSHENIMLLQGFSKAMVDSGLKEKTIQKHLNNVDFYINDFLNYYEEKELAEDGWQLIDEFLGDWFIRKAMWSSPTTVKEYITSLKKFYKYMLDSNNIEKDAYEAFLEIIKDYKETWIEGARFDEEDFYDQHLEEDTDDFDGISEGVETLALSIFAKKPWERLSSEDFLCIESGGQPYFLFFLGNSKIIYGLMVCEGIQGLNLHLDILNDGNIHPEEIQFKKHGFELYFDHEMLEVYYSQPGYTQRGLSIKENNVLEDILNTLNKHMVHMNKLQVNLYDKDCLQKLSIEKNKTVVEMITLDEVRKQYFKPFALRYYPDDLRIKRIQKMKTNHKIWGMTSFYVPISVSDYFPRVTVILDLATDTIIFKDTAEPSQVGPEAVSTLMSTIETHGKPKKIIFPYGQPDGLLFAMALLLNIEFEFNDSDMLKDFKNNFYDHVLDFEPDDALHSSKPAKIDNFILKHDTCLRRFTKDDLITIGKVSGLSLSKGLKKDLMIERIKKKFQLKEDLFDMITLLEEEEYDFLLQCIKNPEVIYDQSSFFVSSFLIEQTFLAPYEEHDHILYKVPVEIIETFDQIDLDLLTKKRDVVQIYSDFMTACMNFYGVLKVEEMFELSKIYIDEPIEHLIRFKELLAFILRRERLFNALDAFVFHIAFEETNMNYQEMYNPSKALYLPEKHELLNYIDDSYIEQTEGVVNLKDFIKKQWHLNDEEIDEIIFEIKDEILATKIDYVFFVLEEYGATFKSESQVNKFIKLYTKFRNSSRSWFNRGHSANDLSQKTISESVKVGRNEPCPCGSGKKYKKCCGR